VRLLFGVEGPLNAVGSAVGLAAFGGGVVRDLLEVSTGPSSKAKGRLRSCSEVPLAITFVVRELAVRADGLSDMTLETSGHHRPQPIREMRQHASDRLLDQGTNSRIESNVLTH